MFNHQIDDKKLSFIEPFCVINVDDPIVTKVPDESPQKVNEIDIKPVEAVRIKEEHSPMEENSGETFSGADTLNTDSNAMFSDCEDDLSYNYDDDDDEDANDGDGDDENNSSDTSSTDVREKKKRCKTSRSTKSFRDSKQKAKASRQSRKYTKKISFTTVNVLDEDNKRLLSYVQMKCDVCSDNRVFDSFSEIQTHFMDTHNQTGYIMCCNRKFRRIGRVLQHCTWHDNPEAFKCDTCNKCFQDNVCLRDHITSMHIPVDERRFQCDQCSRLFAKQHLLNTHLKMKHTVKEERPFVCTEGECNQRFVLPAYLRLHIEKVHNKADSR